MDDSNNRLSNSFSILNIDIDKCLEIVYNKANLEGISDLEVFGAILSCKYLEDINSILERRPLDMDKDEFTNKVKDAMKDKDTNEAIKLEKTWEERWAWIEANANSYYEDKGHKEGLAEGLEQGLEQGREDKAIEIIENLLIQKINYEIISNVTGKTIDEIKKIEKQMN